MTTPENGKKTRIELTVKPSKKDNSISIKIKGLDRTLELEDVLTGLEKCAESLTKRAILAGKFNDDNDEVGNA